MDDFKLIVFNRWYLFIFSILYCLLLFYLTRNNEKVKWLKPYAVVLQCAFLIFYYSMAVSLASMKSSNYDFFGYGLSLFYVLSYSPFIYLINLNFRKSKTIIKFSLIFLSILLGVALYYPFIISTYGFAP